MVLKLFTKPKIYKRYLGGLIAYLREAFRPRPCKKGFKISRLVLWLGLIDPNISQVTSRSGFQEYGLDLKWVFYRVLSYLDLFGSILSLILKPSSHLEPPRNSTSTNTRQNLIIGQSFKKGNIFRTKGPMRFKVKIPQIILPHPKTLQWNLQIFSQC